jgi:hypothetical protein
MKPLAIRKTTARDAWLATRIIRHAPRASGVALRTVIEARRNGLAISEACALIEHESGWRNIMGCDKGGPYCHQRVTKAKVLHLVRHVLNGGTSNGVGHGQLTWIGYIQEANRDGGAWVPRVNIATALKIMGGHKRRHGWKRGLAVYNAGHPSSLHGQAYARRVDALKKTWHNRLA